MDKILILDFGSRYRALIESRVLELGILSALIPGDIPLGSLIPSRPGEPDSGGDVVRGLILSGSPASVYTQEGPVPDRLIYASGLPLLGICYGLQRMTKDLGGLVEALPQREEGPAEVRGRFPPAEDFESPGAARRFFAAFDKTLTLEDIRSGAVPARSGEWALNSWMTHGDSASRLAPGFRQYGVSPAGSPSVLIHESNPWFAVQFHPEVPECERGVEVLAAFCFGVAGCSSGLSAPWGPPGKRGKEPPLISGGSRARSFPGQKTPVPARFFTKGQKTQIPAI